MSSARRFSNISNAATTLPERSSKRLCQENNPSSWASVNAQAEEPLKENHTFKGLKYKLTDSDWLFCEIQKPPVNELWEYLKPIGFTHSQHSGYSHPQFGKDLSQSQIQQHILQKGIPDQEKLNVSDRLILEIWLRSHDVVNAEIASNARNVNARTDGYKTEFKKLDNREAFDLVCRHYCGEPIDLILDTKFCSQKLPLQRSPVHTAVKYTLAELRGALRRNLNWIRFRSIKDETTRLALQMWIACSPIPLWSSDVDVVPTRHTDATEITNDNSHPSNVATSTAASANATEMGDNSINNNVSPARNIHAIYASNVAAASSVASASASTDSPNHVAQVYDAIKNSYAWLEQLKACTDKENKLKKRLNNIESTLEEYGFEIDGDEQDQKPAAKERNVPKLVQASKQRSLHLKKKIEKLNKLKECIEEENKLKDHLENLKTTLEAAFDEKFGEDAPQDQKLDAKEQSVRKLVQASKERIAQLKERIEMLEELKESWNKLVPN